VLKEADKVSKLKEMQIGDFGVSEKLWTVKL
jgi:hypothetical protein